jgi:hypothetical protein
LEPDVEGTFEELPPLETPHRWKDNRQLGAKLVEVRKAILSGQSVDLRRPPFVWRQLPADTEDSLTAQVAACEALHAASGSVVAIRRWPNECYTVAGRLRGRDTYMGEMDCKDLLASAASIERVTGVPRCAAVFEFID